MRQYLDAKRQHRDAIVFFRMGDFYEMFYEDALVAARALDLTLTSRSKDGDGGAIPMCGVPFHAVDGYLARAGDQRISRRDLRAGRRPQKGQGPRQARSRPRRFSRHPHRCRYLAAREPAYLMCYRRPAGAVRRRPDRPFYRRVHERRILRCRRASRRWQMKSRSCVRERSSSRQMWPSPTGFPRSGGCRSRDHGRTMDLRVRIGAPVAARAAQSPRPRRVRPRRPHRSHQAAGGLVAYLRDTQKADLAHVRSIAYKTTCRRPRDRPDHAEASGGRRGQRRHGRRFAAARDRSGR